MNVSVNSYIIESLHDMAKCSGTCCLLVRLHILRVICQPGAACPPTQPRGNMYQTSDERRSEEGERMKENRDVKVSRLLLKTSKFSPVTRKYICLILSFVFQDFIGTLDANMVKRLCIRSLRRGVGSMDYIQSLLIMEDDLDDDEEEHDTGDTSTSTSLAVQKTISQPDPETPHEGVSPQWCKCDRCRVMPQEVENKCCGQRRCVTSHTRFTKLCLDPDVLLLAVRNRGDIRNEREDNSTRSFPGIVFSVSPLQGFHVIFR